MLEIHIHNVEQRNESNLYQLAVLEIMQVINFETSVLVSYYETQQLCRTGRSNSHATGFTKICVKSIMIINAFKRWSMDNVHIRLYL